MLSRRHFLMAIPAAGLSLKSAGAANGLRIRRVDIVHHTHTDVGYTEAPAVVRELQKHYIDTAIECCRSDPHFRWTIESLLELDDWWKANPESRRQELLALVKSGQVDAMGLPLNQTPFQNAIEWRQMMSWIPPNVWNDLQIRAAMQNDVNGFPRAGAMALLDHGCRHFLMGLNPDSGGPPFRRPSAFWWRMPDGRRLFVWLGEHYGSAINYLKPAWDNNHLRSDDEAVRAAHSQLVQRLQQIEADGYVFDRLLLTYTNPLHYDNGGPVPSLSTFIQAWNRLGLQPELRITLATDAVLGMEREVGKQIPDLEGEWTDWWANGDASGPRELAASRCAKRYLLAAMSPVLGPIAGADTPAMTEILRDLCLFDEHTFGADRSISEPYSLRTIGQYVEKSELAYRPLGLAQHLMLRRARARVRDLPEGIHVINPAGTPLSGWAAVASDLIPPETRSIVSTASGEHVALEKQGNQFRFWIANLAPDSVRSFRPGANVSHTDAAHEQPLVLTGDSGWPRTATWPGMAKPLFDGGLGDFLAVEVIPPADRGTIKRLHDIADPAERESIRAKSLRQVDAAYGPAESADTPHTITYTQQIRHPRLTAASRTLELWKREPRARVSIQFDRISSIAPEVLFISFHLPFSDVMPVASNGGVPFTPYRDQLRGSCRDYFAIDGWTHYRSPGGDWLWVTRDAALIALGRPHVGELHQNEPAERGRVLAMVFDNCWHTNFVADSHGPMEFEFELAWKPKIDDPSKTADALLAEPLVIVNPAVGQPL